MSYKNTWVYSSSNGAPIKVESLPIGSDYSFTDALFEISSVLDTTEVFKEISFRNNGRVSFDIKNILCTVNKPTSFLNEILDICGIKIDSPGDFVIISSMSFQVNPVFELVRLISANQEPIINVIKNYTYLVFYKFNVMTEEITRGSKIFQPPKEFGITNHRFIAKLSDNGLQAVNVDILDLDPTWSYSSTPILNSHTKDRNGKYYTGLPVFNKDWQLNGEYESRIVLHPRIFPLTMKFYRSNSENIKIQQEGELSCLNSQEALRQSSDN